MVGALKHCFNVYAISKFRSKSLESNCKQVYYLNNYSEKKIRIILNQIDPFETKKILIGSGFAENIKTNYLGKRENIGNSFKTLKNLNSPDIFFDKLKRCKITFPKWKYDIPKNKKNWLMKGKKSIGGLLVQKLKKEKISKFSCNHYFQKFIEGDVVSVQFFSYKYHINLLSTNSQWVYKKADPTLILGGVITKKLSENLRKKIKTITKKISLNFELNGLNSVDFIISKKNKKIYVIEINGRPGLTINSLKEIYGEKLFIRKNKFIFSKKFCSSSIVYSKKCFFFDKKIRAKLKLMQHKIKISEIGFYDEVIEEKEPICIIHSCSKSKKKTKHIIEKYSKKIIDFAN